jgi:hypothetical protein
MIRARSSRSSWEFPWLPCPWTVRTTSSGPNACHTASTHLPPRCGTTWPSARAGTRTSPPSFSLAASSDLRRTGGQAERLAAHAARAGCAQGRPRGAVHAELPATGDCALRHPAGQCRGGAGQPDEPGRRAQALHHRSGPKSPSPPATWRRSSPRPAMPGPQDERLAHLIVTQFTDAFDAGVRAGRTAAGRLARLAAHPPPLPHWQVAMCMHGRCAGRRHARSRTGDGPGRPGILPYTSGTTGLPKGCMHTHQHHAQRRGQQRSGATPRPRT